MRALVALLLLANGLFFALSQGWLEPVLALHSAELREPQRLAAQIEPDALRVLGPAQLAGIAASSGGCVRAGPIGAEQLPAAEALLAQAASAPQRWQRESIEQPPSWMLYVGKLADHDSLLRRQDELRRSGFSAEEVQTQPALQPGLSLGRFADRAAAEAALAELTQRGLRGAKVVALAATSSTWIRVPRADPALRERLTALPAEAFGGGFVPCANLP
jgi:hypothetical protein